jgi:hypothetical protein
VFIDLHLAAGIALLFIAALKIWNGWRRNYWCEPFKPSTDHGLLAVRSILPLADVGLDQLINLLEQSAPQCRVVGGDAAAAWPARLRWPEMLHVVCIHGPMSQLVSLQTNKSMAMIATCGAPVLSLGIDKPGIAKQARQISTLL